MPKNAHKRYRDYLSHHGIKGQKWGKRNGPPYPLDEEDRSAAEKKAADGKGHSKTEEFISDNKDISAIAINGNKPISEDAFRKDLINKNPNAAIADPGIRDYIKAHKKQIIAIGVASAVIVGSVAIAKYGKAQVPFDAGRSDIKDKLDNILDANVGGVKVSDINLEDVQSKEALGGFASKPERFLKAWLYVDSHRFDPISIEEFDNMTNKDAVNLNAGHAMYRLSKSAHNSLREGFEYVSINEEDRLRYVGFLPQMWSAKGANVRNSYEAVLKSFVDIKAPGKKESILLMESALKKAFPGYTDEMYRKDILKNFYAYQAQLVNRADKLGRYYAEELRANGYNAMIDFNDAGRLSNTPLILINGHDTADVENVIKYGRTEAKKIFDNITLPDALKDFNIEQWNKYSKGNSYLEFIAKQYLK